MTTESRRAVLAGVGNMGRKWLSCLTARPDVEVVGIVDLDQDLAKTVAKSAGLGDVPIGSNLETLLSVTGASVLVDATVPGAHHTLTLAALRQGCDVLGEKPAAANVAQTLSLCAASETYGGLFMVSQSRRYNPNLEALRTARDHLGGVGILQADFYRGPRFGGFREQMEFPLLVDMAIHPFDTARYILGAEPVAVYCQSFNPSWSWYRGDACAMVVVEMSNGARFAYNASWCSADAETSWNGAWRLVGADATILWDGEAPPELIRRDSAEPVALASEISQATQGIAGALNAFLEGLEQASAPHGHVHENVFSVAMIEAAVASAQTGTRVGIGDVLREAHERALKQEADARVRARLAAWGDVEAHLWEYSGANS